jgi:hypothetical protein
MSAGTKVACIGRTRHRVGRDGRRRECRRDRGRAATRGHPGDHCDLGRARQGGRRRGGRRGGAGEIPGLARDCAGETEDGVGAGLTAFPAWSGSGPGVEAIRSGWAKRVEAAMASAPRKNIQEKGPACAGPSLFLGRKHPTEDTKNVTQTVATVVAEMSHSQLKFSSGYRGRCGVQSLDSAMGFRSRAGLAAPSSESNSYPRTPQA